MAQNRPPSGVPYESVQPEDALEHERDPPSIAMTELPPGAARPRFMGAALADDGPRPISAYSSVRDDSPTPTPAGGFSRQGSDYYVDSVQGLNGERYRDDPFSAEDIDAGPLDTEDGPVSGKGKPGFFENKRDLYASTPSRARRRLLLLAGLASGTIVVLVIVLGVYFGVVKHSKARSSSSSGSGPGNGNGGGNNGGGNGGGSNSSSPHGNPKTVVVTGGDGSTVTMADGSTFTYNNNFGGFWYSDPNDPFSNNARAQSWSPALNETFQYGVDQIRGVNLGGWLVTEPFIVPALYEKYENNTPNSIDEWTLSINMRADTSGGGGIGQLETHYQTFVTEQDFAEIAAAGLNFVRIPLPYWAIEVRGEEPFLEGVCWKYFLMAIEWARKYGLRINLDFHTLPGSQNGWNHSGRLGTYNVLYGPMGYANAQRALEYIRIIAEFISQPEYAPVVQLFGITNEPAKDITQPILEDFYFQAYQIIRNITGIGEGKGPYISLHDGFQGQAPWAGFMTGADRISLDTHPYIAFDGQSAAPMSSFIPLPCSKWGNVVNDSQVAFGLSTAGEFSNAVNDCGLWVNGVKQGVRFEGTYPGYSTYVGSCEPYTDWANWNETYKAEVKHWAMNSMDALQYYFFWTWKVGNSSVTGTVEAPHWSYQLGLQNGWMPTDPREAIGSCGNTDPRTGPLEPWMTGGSGAGEFAAGVTAGLQWPPESLVRGEGPLTQMIYYTPTGAIPTLPAPTYTLDNGTIVGGSGWYDSDDTVGAVVNVTGCEYPDPWYGDDSDTAIAVPWCSVANVAARAPAPTPAPTARS